MNARTAPFNTHTSIAPFPRRWWLPRLFCCLAFILLGVATALHAQVPQLVNYQGRVSVGTVNFNGSGSFRFALVNTDGSVTYWSNDGTSSAGSQPTAAVSLTVTNGLYSVLLGDTTLPNMTAVPNSVFANSDVRLRVWFNDGTNGAQLLTPDQRIASVGYAMVAGTLQSGANITAGTVTATSFSGSGAGLTNIPASALGTTPPGMVLIPGGTFTMGNSIGDSDITNATPVVTTVSAFYMDVNEVSLSQWQSVYNWATSNGYAFVNAGAGKAANHPVQTVDWYDCVKWCNARSEQAGKTPVYYTDPGLTVVYRTGEPGNVYVDWVVSGYRLPTEAEWEKAARGGRSNQRFPWGNTISQSQANYLGNTAGYSYDLGPNGFNPIGSVGGTNPATSPGGSFAANGYRLYDMAGNVLEWCWDRYGTPYAGGIDPRGPDSGPYRVWRGGDWWDYAYQARCAQRSAAGPSFVYVVIGFRSVLPPSQ